MKSMFSFSVAKSLAVLAGLAIALGGCSSTYPVRYTTVGNFNEELRGEYATITVQGGNKMPAKMVEVSTDSIGWRNEKTNEGFKVGMQDVERIVIVKKNSLAGAIMGLGVCGLLGAGVGWAVSGSESEGYRREYGVLQIFLGALVGSTVGLAAGAVIGHPENYEYQLKERDGSTKKKARIETERATTDTLYLTNGDIVRGTILTEVGDDELSYVTIRNAEGETRTYYRSDVERIAK
jgi:hypothetical protein